MGSDSGPEPEPERASLLSGPAQSGLCDLETWWKREKANVLLASLKFSHLCRGWPPSECKASGPAWGEKQVEITCPCHHHSALNTHVNNVPRLEAQSGPPILLQRNSEQGLGESHPYHLQSGRNNCLSPWNVAKKTELTTRHCVKF